MPDKLSIPLTEGLEELAPQAIGKHFQGIRSWGGSLDAAIRNMIDEEAGAGDGIPISFSKSRQAAVLVAVAEYFRSKEIPRM